MIFFRDKEKQQQKQREKEEEKQKEEEEKQLKKQQKEEQERLKLLEKQQKDVDIAKLAPTPIAPDEQILYRWNISKGTFRTKVIVSYFVTNYRIATATIDNPTSCDAILY
jgi:hypothetical protein